MSKAFSMFVVIVGSVFGIVWARENLAVEIITQSDFNMGNTGSTDEGESIVNIFDCPACSLPSELVGVINDFDENGMYKKFYLTKCFGDHETVAVTEDWLHENVIAI